MLDEVLAGRRMPLVEATKFAGRLSYAATATTNLVGQAGYEEFSCIIAPAFARH